MSAGDEEAKHWLSHVLRRQKICAISHSTFKDRDFHAVKADAFSKTWEGRLFCSRLFIQLRSRSSRGRQSYQHVIAFNADLVDRYFEIGIKYALTSA